MTARFLENPFLKGYASIVEAIQLTGEELRELDLNGVDKVFSVSNALVCKKMMKAIRDMIEGGTEATTSTPQLIQSPAKASNKQPQDSHTLPQGKR